jgi:hypothetical protein
MDEDKILTHQQGVDQYNKAAYQKSVKKYQKEGQQYRQNKMVNDSAKQRAGNIITKAIAKTNKPKHPSLEEIGDRYIRDREGMY